MPYCAGINTARSCTEMTISHFSPDGRTLMAGYTSQSGDFQICLCWNLMETDAWAWCKSLDGQNSAALEGAVLAPGHQHWHSYAAILWCCATVSISDRRAGTNRPHRGTSRQRWPFFPLTLIQEMLSFFFDMPCQLCT